MSIVQSLNVEVWRGYDTAYGHAPGEFEFAGGTLPFRLMYPEHYDPEKQYPLVLSVPGSGGVGNDNVKSMEMTVPGRFFFTTLLRRSVPGVLQPDHADSGGRDDPVGVLAQGVQGTTQSDSSGLACGECRWVVCTGQYCPGADVDAGKTDSD